MKKLATALLCVLLGVTCTSAFSACKDNGPTSDSSGGKPPVVVDSNPTVVGGGDTFYFFAETGKDLEFTINIIPVLSLCAASGSISTESGILLSTRATRAKTENIFRALKNSTIFLFRSLMSARRAGSVGKNPATTSGIGAA